MVSLLILQNSSNYLKISAPSTNCGFLESTWTGKKACCCSSNSSASTQLGYFVKVSFVKLPTVLCLVESQPIIPPFINQQGTRKVNASLLVSSHVIYGKNVYRMYWALTQYFSSLHLLVSTLLQNNLWEQCSIIPWLGKFFQYSMNISIFHATA